MSAAAAVAALPLFTPAAVAFRATPPRYGLL